MCQAEVGIRVVHDGREFRRVLFRSLSDEGTEDAVYDSQAIRGFIGVDLGRESAPDATTLLRFRRLLETHQLTRVLFETINQHLASRGLLRSEVRRVG